jgi:HlyD family secretion protein
MKKNRVKIAAIALIGIGVFAFYLNSKIIKKKQIVHVVDSYPIKSIRQYKGILRPSVTVWYNAEFNKEIVWRIETGVNVKMGDPVLKYQTTDLEEEIEGHEEGVVDKKATLEGLILQQQTELEKAVLDTTELKIRVEIEKFNYNKAKNEPSDLVKLEQEILLKEDQVRKDFVESKLKTSQSLYQKGLISETALQTSKINFVRAESDYFKTKINYQVKLAGVSPIKIARLAKQLELAELRLQNSIDNEKSLKEIHRLKEISIKEDIFTIQNKVDRFKKNIESSTIKAPFDGKVYFPSIYKGSMSSESIEIGETPIKGVGLLYFTNSSEFDVDFIIAESDIKYIKEGLIVNFELTSNPNVKIKGEIYKLSEIASDKNVLLGDLALARKGEANVKMIQVSVHLKDTHKDLRQGITGTIRLNETNNNCLAIPLNFIKEKNQKYFVMTNKKVLKEITIGINDGFFVEVISGLSKGDTIIHE